MEAKTVAGFWAYFTQLAARDGDDMIRMSLTSKYYGCSGYTWAPMLFLVQFWEIDHLLLILRFPVNTEYLFEALKGPSLGCLEHQG